ncbi:MAG: 4Fe-4S dicluster domain-containing protein [Dehalococcoidales bacterium]|nr:4Fe-4S dicluster domain-containing protein [Dehalococcoidales bacterium]
MAAHKVDLTLLQDLKKYGAFDVEACFNCGNCTAVCQHSDETAGFPRRLIRYGQLGMRDRVLSAKEAWLCWNCRDCSDTCPRQARPSEYLEAVRRYAIASLDPTGLSRLLYTSGLFLGGFALVLAILFAGVLLSQAGAPAAGVLDLFSFIPFELIHNVGLAVMGVIGLIAVVNVVRMVGWLAKATELAGPQPDSSGEGGSLPRRVLAAVGAVLGEMGNQKRYRACEVEAGQPLPLRPWFVHYAIMWGFIGLVLATVFDFLFKTPGVIVPLWYPSRLLGTVAGLALMYGTGVAIARRLQPADRTQFRMLPSDWLFMGLLFTVGLTGFLLEALVYAPQAGDVGYVVFLIHVVLAMELIVLLPFTKFAHAIYRPLAYGIYRFRTARTQGAGAEAVGESA